MIKSLDNYRKLKPDEVIRQGDVYVPRGTINKPTPVKHSIGARPGNTWYSHWDFYRRRHTKKVSTVSTPAVKTKVDTKPKLNVAIVTFKYHGVYRQVQVIKMDQTYLKGLEIANSSERKSRYQFKTFRKDNITSSIILQSYGPAE